MTQASPGITLAAGMAIGAVTIVVIGWVTLPYVVERYTSTGLRNSGIPAPIADLSGRTAGAAVRSVRLRDVLT